ncbi:Transmembrane domain-containing protein [Cedratvirus Zaza IHUMI]|uniref:Transmembrane domain-containing protein n=1 Tax=Cedratvirus Zaza IHUMI TaxID=2126979 RepID=A0A2R8FCZ5_9VIRU|nr:Transmembrane domain-containing protein [Cedratvirus Zaza IHUMI]
MFELFLLIILLTASFKTTLEIPLLITFLVFPGWWFEIAGFYFLALITRMAYA